MTREVWITGTGLLSALGEGEDAIRAALDDPRRWRAAIDSQAMAPYHIHPIRDLNLDRHIAKKSDQRQMGPLMQLGAYGAGMALANAGVAGNADLLKRLNMIVAATGGERDPVLDGQIVAEVSRRNDRDTVLNERLVGGLRPTLFLSQLPNLFAGNISIVHGVAGSSRTFMGEEAAGVDALRVAFQSIAAGQGDQFLVGSAYAADRGEMALLFNAGGGHLLRGAFAPVWRRPQAGICMGSMAAFLVIEAREHAEARGAKPLARIADIRSERSTREAGAARANAERQWAALVPRLRPGPLAVLSGATGVGPITQEERAMLADWRRAWPQMAVRGTGTAIGHGFEAQFLANVVLAVDAVRRGGLFAPLDPDEPLEADLRGGVSQAVVTQWGFWRGEGLALIEAVS